MSTESRKFSIEDAHAYAQRQASIYETYLKALSATIYGIRGAGITVTPKALQNARIEFYKQTNLLITLLAQTDIQFGLTDVAGKEELQAFTNRCLVANKGTFDSALRFGEHNVFHLIDAWGAMGFLAQNRASKIEWKVRSANGSSLDAIRAFYVSFRDYAYQAMLDKVLKEESIDPYIYIINKDKEIINKWAVKELLDRKSSVRKGYFHIGSNNWLETLGERSGSV